MTWPPFGRVATDCFDCDVVGAGGEGFDVCPVAGEDSAAGFCEGDGESRQLLTAPCASANFGRAPGCQFGDKGFDDAGLEEPVRGGIAPAVALQRFDENGGWCDRWPLTVIAEGSDESEARVERSTRRLTPPLPRVSKDQLVWWS